MANCMDCLYTKVCSDFASQGCCDADCCSDFKSKRDVVSLKLHIGDHLYEPVAKQVTTYRISGIVVREDIVLYLLDVESGEASRRTSIAESEIDKVFLTYQEALNSITKEFKHCKDCIHFKVCDNAAETFSAIQRCENYIKISDVVIYPCSAGQTFYVVKPAAAKHGIFIDNSIAEYVVDHLYASKYADSFDTGAVVLRDRRGGFCISVDGFAHFKCLLNDVFFCTAEAAKLALEQYMEV